MLNNGTQIILEPIDMKLQCKACKQSPKKKVEMRKCEILLPGPQMQYMSHIGDENRINRS